MSVNDLFVAFGYLVSIIFLYIGAKELRRGRDDLSRPTVALGLSGFLGGFLLHGFALAMVGGMASAFDGYQRDYDTVVKQQGTQHLPSIGDFSWPVFAVMGVMVLAVVAWVWIEPAIRRNAESIKNAAATRVTVTSGRDRSALKSEWAAYRARAADVRDAWLVYDTDLHELLRAPAMRDFSRPEIADVVTSIDVMSGLDVNSVPKGVTNVAESDFANAVRKAEASLKVATTMAHRDVESRMNARERSMLTEARNLLDIALNEASTPNERQSAYQRVTKLMKSLGVSMPEKAMAELSTTIRQAIEAPKHIGMDNVVPIRREEIA